MKTTNFCLYAGFNVTNYLVCLNPCPSTIDCKHLFLSAHLNPVNNFWTGREEIYLFSLWLLRTVSECSSQVAPTSSKQHGVNVGVNASATAFQQASGYGSHGYSTGNAFSYFHATFKMQKNIQMEWCSYSRICRELSLPVCEKLYWLVGLNTILFLMAEFKPSLTKLSQSPLNATLAKFDSYLVCEVQAWDNLSY